MKATMCLGFVCLWIFLFSSVVESQLSDASCPYDYHYCEGTIFCCQSGYICTGTTTCLHLAIIIGPIVGLVVLIVCIVVCCICCRRRRATPGVVYSPTPQAKMWGRICIEVVIQITTLTLPITITKHRQSITYKVLNVLTSNEKADKKMHCNPIWTSKFWIKYILILTNGASYSRIIQFGAFFWNVQIV